MLLYVCFYGWPFDTGQPISVLFPGEDHFSQIFWEYKS